MGYMSCLWGTYYKGEGHDFPKVRAMVSFVRTICIQCIQKDEMYLLTFSFIQYPLSFVTSLSQATYLRRLKGF
jgi:hypothetical protein